MLSMQAVRGRLAVLFVPNNMANGGGGVTKV